MKRNRFIKFTDAKKSVNRELGAKARTGMEGPHHEPHQNGSHMTRDCWGPRGPVVREDQAASPTTSPRRSTVTGRRSASVTTTSAHRPARSAPTDGLPRICAPWTLAA